MCEADRLIKLVFSGLSPLVIEKVSDEGGLVRVRARTPEVAVTCPGCGVPTSRVHSYAERTVADVAIDERQVLLGVRVRRLVCPTRGCRQTFREQLPGVLERYQRRTPRLAAQIGVVVRELAGRGSVRVLSTLTVCLSVQTALRCLLRLPLPPVTVPRVLGVDDFALRR
ncbi:transposase family protein, partial [Frankia sp. Cj5]|uniref:transposase family protein n=1 Tax=Frankia sp. Cj5 TaxID=2880978 RepID=UPI001EF59BE0